MAKRYYNENENKFYTEGECMMRSLPNGGLWGGRPTDEQLEEWGYVEYTDPVVEPIEIPIEQQYKELVVSKIRSMYTIDDELALQRQKESKEQEWQAYYNYCEQCKSEAREELGYNESEEE